MRVVRAHRVGALRVWYVGATTVSRATPSNAGDRANPAERWGAFLVGLLVLIVPVVVMPSARDSFALPKLVVAQVLGLASLVVLAFQLLSSGRITRWRPPALMATVPLVAVAALGWIFTSHRVLTAEGLAALAIGIACLVGWSVGIGARKLDVLLALLTVPAAVLAMLALLQAFKLFQPFAFAARGRMAISSLAGNVGALGAFLVLPLLIAQTRLRSTKRRSWYWWWFVAVIVLSVAGLASTQTLTPLLAAGAGSALLWYVLLPRRRWFALAACLLIVGGLLVAGVAPLRSRAVHKWEAVRSGNVNALLTGRLDGWRAALWMIEHHPLLGVGEGAFVAEFVPAKLALIDKGVRFDVYQTTPVFSHAHNEFLEVGADLGIVGLVALAWALFILGRVAICASAGAASERALMWAGLLALALLSLADFPFRLALVGYPATLFLAWIFRSAAEVEES